MSVPGITSVAAADPLLTRLLRLALGLAVAVSMTFALYTLMASLVAAGRNAMTDTPSDRLVDFVRLKQEPDLEIERPKPKKPDKPELPPSDVAPPTDAVSEAVAAATPQLGALGIEGGIPVNTGFGLSAGDGEYLPIVKVAPIYPSRAQTRGIEGWVLLQFTVSQTGAVINPQVIEAEPAGMFERAAIQAVLKFKYKPRMEGGTPVAVDNVQHLITFKLEK